MLNYTCSKMTAAAQKLLRDVLALPEEERVELATEIIASLDGPPDADWEQAWTAEIDRRLEEAKTQGHNFEDWVDVRARILKQLGRD
jgi:putative addiction module component (TIGR02574 family)